MQFTRNLSNLIKLSIYIYIDAVTPLLKVFDYKYIQCVAGKISPSEKMAIGSGKNIFHDCINSCFFVSES